MFHQSYNQVREKNLFKSIVTCLIGVFFELRQRQICSRKVGLRSQALSKQADAQSRPKVGREMLAIKCLAWECLSIATLECTSPAKRFPPKLSLKRNSFLPNH